MITKNFETIERTVVRLDTILEVDDTLSETDRFNISAALISLRAILDEHTDTFTDYP